MTLALSAHQRQLQDKKRLQQHKLTSDKLFRIQHQSKSDPSSSDDGMPQPPIMHHRIATGIHLVHNQTVAHAGFISEAIEMKKVGINTFLTHHRNVQYEDSVKTKTSSAYSPRTVGSDHDLTETNLSMETTRSPDKDKSYYKRSHSYHGKLSKGL